MAGCADIQHKETRLYNTKRQDLLGWKGKDERIGELGWAVGMVKI